MPELKTTDSDCLVWENGLCWLATVVDGREQCNYLGEIGAVDEVRAFCESHGHTVVGNAKGPGCVPAPASNQTVVLSEVNPITHF